MKFKINKIEELRLERKLAKQEVYKGIGVSRVAYDAWEKMLSKPSIDNLEKLSEFYKISICSWWEEEPAEAENQNSNHLNEPKMNYGKFVPRDQYEDMKEKLEGEIDFLRSMVKQDYKSKTAS